MIIKRFSFKTLDECIDKACKQLKISKDELNYKVVEEKNTFFLKKVVIDVYLDDEEKINEKKINNKVDGNARVENGNIIVENPINNGENATIMPCENLYIIVDGKRITKRCEVSKESKIKIINKDENPKRDLKIEIDSKRMNAYITIKYIPKIIYKLKNCDFKTNLKLEEEIVKEEYPPFYTKQEILEILEEKKIVYGIIKENLDESLKQRDVNELLIAKGVEPIQDEDDKLEIKFKMGNGLSQITDDMQTVDFRSLNSITEVRKGETLAIKHIGKEGKNGTNVFGREVKRDKKKNVLMKVGQGALINGNKVISFIEGRPEYKNGIFYVYPVYELNDDVDIANGNIDFIGEVSIRGNVKEGMKVKAQGKILIEKNVTQAEICGSDDIIIQKNIISSNIKGGGEDFDVLQEMNYLNLIKEKIISLKEAVIQINELTNGRKKIGEILKVLIEKKYKDIPKIYFKLLKFRNINGQGCHKIIELIKNKLIGLSPIQINDIEELQEVIDALDERIKKLEKDKVLPVDVSIGYCQDSVIKSSGNIYVGGKGEYVSNLVSNDSVIFKNDNSVARGGEISAKNKIQCGIVGSDGGVSTILEVEKKGQIIAKKAYQNTKFIVGNREYTLNSCSRDVHVYLNSDGDLNVEKLKG